MRRYGITGLRRDEIISIGGSEALTPGPRLSGETRVSIGEYLRAIENAETAAKRGDAIIPVHVEALPIVIAYLNARAALQAHEKTAP